MDYRISDVYSDPPGMTEKYHTETIVRLPDILWCYQPPVSPMISAAIWFRKPGTEWGCAAPLCGGPLSRSTYTVFHGALSLAETPLSPQPPR